MLTVTVIADDVTVVPRESTACTVNVAVPAVVGVHASEYGAVVTGDPAMAVPLTRKFTREIVAPAMGAADAVIVTGVFTVAVELFAGPVNDTEVAATAVTVTAFDVTELLAESTTRAVRLKVPAALGTHEIE